MFYNCVNNLIIDKKGVFMLEEEKKHTLLKVIGVIIATFLGAFLAFYFAVDISLNRMLNPDYQMRKMEKIMKHQERNFNKLERKYLDNPFEPRMAPMLVNLVKEGDEYKVIVDLKPLNHDEKNVNVDLKDNIITVTGEIDKTKRNTESIMNFSQSFYLDEKLLPNKISKEKKGDKYIITIPFED